MKNAVVIPTNGRPYRLEVPSESGRSELAVLQRAVGGYIELVPTDLPFTVFCNEEGKIKGLGSNYPATHLFGELLHPHDVIAGNVIVLGPRGNDGDSLSLTDEAADSILDAVDAILNAVHDLVDQVVR